MFEVLGPYSGVNYSSVLGEARLARDDAQWYDPSQFDIKPAAVIGAKDPRNAHLAIPIPQPVHPCDREYIGIIYNLFVEAGYALQEGSQFEKVLVMGVGAGLDAALAFGLYNPEQLTGVQLTVEEWQWVQRHAEKFNRQFDYKYASGCEVLPYLQVQGETYDLILACRGISGINTHHDRFGNRFDIERVIKYFSNISHKGSVLVMDVFTENMEYMLREAWGIPSDADLGLDIYDIYDLLMVLHYAGYSTPLITMYDHTKLLSDYARKSITSRGPTHIVFVAINNHPPFNEYVKGAKKRLD